MTTATREISAPTLPEREHKAGCPAQRIERYTERKPATENTPPRDVVVTRCIDCAGFVVEPAQSKENA